MPPQHDDSTPLPIADPEFWYGESTLYSSRLAALAISRQGRSPVGADPWIAAAREAARDVAGSEATLLASLDPLTWSLPAWLCAQALGQVLLLVPLRRQSSLETVQRQLRQVLDDLELIRQHTLLVPWWQDPRRPRSHWRARDRWILHQATRLLPVSLRPGGLLEELAASAPGEVDRSFQVPYRPARPSHTPPPPPEGVRRTLAPLRWKHAVHWTRAAHGPWPGESRADYFRALVASGEEDPRSGFATLLRILRERRLRGSAWRMPLKRRMVSFSRLHPAEMMERMRWRRRYARQAFEPYGLALPTSRLEGEGGRPVRYLPQERVKTLAPAERLFAQTVSARGADWQGEREWRVEGDLLLEQVPYDELVVLVARQEERDIVREEFGLRAFALEGGA